MQAEADHTHSRRSLQWLGWLFDSVLASAWVVSTLKWPLRPITSDLKDITQPALRLSILALFAVRVVLRVSPYMFTWLEHVNVHTWLAVRLLRAKRSGFLTAIGWLSILSVSVSSCALSTTLSVMGGFRNDLKRKIVDHYAHINVDKPQSYLNEWRAILNKIRSSENVKGASPFVSGEVMLTSSSSIAAVTLRGIDTASIDQVSRLRKNTKVGDLETLDDPTRIKDEHLGIMVQPKPKTDEGPLLSDIYPTIVIGQELARTLRLFVGDAVKVVIPEGSLPKARTFRIGAIFYSGMYEFDVKSAYIALHEAQRFWSLGDVVSGIDVTTYDLEAAPAVATLLARRLGSSLRVRDWQMLNKGLFGALALEKIAMFITLGLAILVASFCIIGALVLMVKEKGREIAVLKAMGATDRSIVKVFLFEGALIGALGAALGLGIGYGVCFAAEHLGVRMNPEIYYIDRLPIDVDINEFVAVALAAVAICLLATLYPSRMASRLSPMEGLRGQ